ncbi:MAG: hypothetical protein HRT52_17835 [Colwellia sp.]|nr:hypothetical protein [Colwellia sp.]
MRGNSKLPFYKQITSSLIAVLLTCIVLLSLATSLFLVQGNQLQTSIDYHIPNLERSYDLQRYFIESEGILEQGLSSETPTELLKFYQQYHQNLQAFSKQQTNQTIKLDKSLLLSDKLSLVVEKIKSNETRNNQLKQNTIIQLQLVIDSLTNIVTDISVQQKQLQQQIMLDKVKDKVTVNRAKAYIAALNLSNQYNQVLTLLSASLLDFTQLNIQVSLSQFRATNQNLEQVIQLWAQLSEHEQSIKGLAIQTEIDQLNHLLFTEQRTMAKWHSHIRLAESVFSDLRVQKQELRRLADNNQLNKQAAIQVIPEFITILTSKMAIKITPTFYRIFLAVCLGLGITLLSLLLLRIRSRIKQHNLESIHLLETLITNDLTSVDNVQIQFSCAENKQLAEIINKLIKPIHSELQYQQLLADNDQSLTTIAQQSAVVNWQYISEKHYIEDNKLLTSLLVDDKALQEKSWRHWFDKSAVALLISTATKAKESSSEQSCLVNTVSGKCINVHINKNEQGWFGTVADHSEINNLEQNIQQLNVEIAGMAKTLNNKDIAYADKLSKMIIRTMLQSQSVSVGSGVSSLQVYRQLTRIFDWCRQTKIRTQLQQSHHTVSAIDISFHDELHAAVFNAMSEARLQRNQIFLHTDAQLVSQANIDIRLFHRTLLGICRLILAEQFKSTLQLNVKVIDKKVGQQIVRFEFIAFLNKPIKKIPEIVSLLICENELLPSNAPEVIRYLQSLLVSLHSENMQVQQSDDGFKLVFDLPITVVVGQDKEQINIDLMQANVLVVSANQVSNEIVESSLSTTSAKVEILTEAKYFKKQVTVKHLNHQKLDVVILADDYFSSDFNNVTQHIASLPKSLRPKLLVMQSSFAARLHVNGLYSQANNPLCRLSFQRELQNLLQDDKVDNCVLTIQELKEHRYLPSQVEVLFAVAVPAKHQVLIRILQWLGLHVHVVCHTQAMTKHWQSGRYLLLFTELSTSPYIELHTGKSIRRGVFTLPTVFHEPSKEQLKTSAKHWVNVNLSTELNINALVTDLAPWLKSKAAALAPENVVLKEDKVSKTNEVEQLLTDVIKAPITEGEGERLKDTPQIFNLLQYAANQGSPELAVYMLDEYMQDIDVAIEELTQAVKDNKSELIQTVIATLLMTTKILSADEFHLCCQNLQQAIIKNDNENISILLSELKEQQLLLVNFAEAI